MAAEPPRGQTNRVQAETKRIASVFSLNTLFLDHPRYWCCHISNYLCCYSQVYFSSPNLSPEFQTHICKDLLAISSPCILQAPQTLLFPLKPLSPSCFLCITTKAMQPHLLVKGILFKRPLLTHKLVNNLCWPINALGSINTSLWFSLSDFSAYNGGVKDKTQDRQVLIGTR